MDPLRDMDGPYRRSPWAVVAANAVALSVAWAFGGPRVVLAVFVAENLVVGLMLLLRLGLVYARRRFVTAVSLGVAFALGAYVLAAVVGVTGLVRWLLQDGLGANVMPMAFGLVALLAGHLAGFAMDDLKAGQVRRVLPLSLVGYSLGRLVVTAGAFGLLGALEGTALIAAVPVAVVLKAGGEAWIALHRGASGAGGPVRRAPA